jgi:hypothetical protein
MNHKRSKLVQVMVVTVAMVGLLVAAWPGVAQDSKPPLKPEMKQFLEERIHEPGKFLERTAEPQTLHAVKTQGLERWPIKMTFPNGIGAALTLKSTGDPQIVYDDVANVGVYFFNGGTEQILNGDAWIGSIVTDSKDQPHTTLGQYDDLMYMHRDGDGWHTEHIGPGGQSRLALDAYDQPHVIYRQDSGNHALYYTYKDNTGWHTNSVDIHAEDRSLSLVLDSEGHPHITYVNNGLKYGYWDGVVWHVQTIVEPGNNPAYPSIALTKQGLPRVSYCSCDPINVNKSILRYAAFDGSQWQIETADDVLGSGIATSLQLDALGQPHISYFRLQSWTSHQLYYARKIGPAWNNEKIRDTSTGNTWPYLFSNLVLDNSNEPHVGYSDNNPGGYYASRANWVDSTRLAFSSFRDNNWEIYTSTADGTNQTRRTLNPAYDSTPKLNRGANRIVFVSSRDGNNEIYVMNIDGSGQTRLTNTPAYEYWPTWSPDGSKIAFYSYRDGNAEIYVMNADGSNQMRLTSIAAWDGHPAWSPDGTQLVFASERSGSGDLWVMNANGTNQHQLTFGLNAAYPDWSPDGSRIILNDDSNNDGWLDVAIINAAGTNLVHPLGYSPTNYDYASPTWSPSGQDYAFTKIQWIYYQGNYYWVDAYLFGVSTGSTYQLTNSGLDWWPDWQATDVWPPSSQVNALPVLLDTPQFSVHWSGIDTGAAGIMSYDIQYRAGANGTWTNWLTATNQTSAVFTGQYGHTYYFRSRVRDYAGNLEAYPSSPDAMTTIYQYSVTGQVLDNRERPVAVVHLQPDPVGLNTGISGHGGLYDLYFASGGVYTLTTTRSNFSQLPPLLNVTVPSSTSLPTLYLSPLDNAISDSHFESGDLSAWGPIGDLIPTITTTAHTGNYAALLGGSLPTDTLTTGPWHSTIEQTIGVSPAVVSGTLSLLYQVAAAEPLSDTLDAYLIGTNNVLTFTLPLTTSGWTHIWFDVSTWTDPTATVKIDFAVSDVDREARIVFDEITWGSAITGSYAVFLPIARR